MWQIVANSLKEVSGGGSACWKSGAVWEEWGSCQLSGVVLFPRSSAQSEILVLPL